MDPDRGVSMSVGEEFDGDTKPLVGRERGQLNRQTQVEPEGRGVGSPVASSSGSPAEGQAGEADTGGGDLCRDQSSSFNTNTEPSKARMRHSGPDRMSLTEPYYGASVDVTGLPIDFSSSQVGKRTATKQSRRLPYWVWFVLAKSLGIKMHAGDRPWFGTAMHILTLIFAAGFAITHTWYKVYDIVSHDTKETILTGGVSIVLVLYWCSLGIYANKLAGRLFMIPKFLESVRLHSKTVFKMSAAGMMVLLGVAEVVVNAVSNKAIYDDGYCQQVSLSVEVCKVLYIMRIGNTILTVIWNLLVGIILLSVCRTHTIGIRRFIRELEEDGKIYETFRKDMSLQGALSEQAKDGDYNSLDEDHDSWDDVLSPRGEDGIYPKLMSYHHATTSPCYTPTRKSCSRHTSQASAATTSTALLPEALPNSNSTQVFSTINSQYFPSNPNLTNYTCNPRLNASNLNTLTVEAEVVAQNSPGSVPCGQHSHTTTQQEQADVQQGQGFPAPGQRVNNTDGNGAPIESMENGAAGAHPMKQWRSNESDTEGVKDGVPETNPDGTPRVPHVPQHSRPIIIIREGSVATAEDSTEPITADQQATNQNLIAADPPSFASRSTRSGCESPHQSTRVELGSPRRAPSSVTGVTDGSPSDDNLSLGLHMLTSDEILLTYWKIGSRLRSTSLALQRWLCALMMFIIVWSLTFIIWWVKHSATLIDITAFLIPILLLPLICSAYGEVNFEGQRMLKSICPTQERMSMLFFLTQNPLQLTAFGFAINYGLIVGALGALGVAFATRLILDEVSM